MQDKYTRIAVVATLRIVEEFGEPLRPDERDHIDGLLTAHGWAMTVTPTAKEYATLVEDTSSDKFELSDFELQLLVHPPPMLGNWPTSLTN